MTVAQGPEGRSSVGQAAVADAGVVARSARLSFITDGAVSIVRGDENERLPAQRNMALAQGDRVTTNDKGQAEIEFEDGSVARLTPNSSLSFDVLGTKSDGDGAISVLRVVRGLVYLELRASEAGRYRVVAGGDSFWPVENAAVRVKLDEPPAIFSVLDGRILLEHGATGSAGSSEAVGGYRTEVRGGESLRADANDPSRYFLSEGIAPDTWDQWNEERDQAAADALSAGTGVRDGFAGTQGYGWGDLDSSGSWYAGDGQAPVWQPREALDAGFDPYGYGSWTYFPGGGYVWASGYGWGWTPFRCGNWQYWDGFGWGWQPNSFCGGGWRYGSGVNIFRGPRGYAPPGIPIKRPGGVHPILPGRHGGERPPPVAGVRDGEVRRIGGVALRPIRPGGFGVTSRGGSAVGSALRLDYAVDGRTHTAVLGAVPASGTARQPASAQQGWRVVNTRPEGPAGGGVGNVLGHRGGMEAPVRTDSKGSPSLPAGRHEGAGTAMGQDRSVPSTVGQGIPQRVQPGGGYHPPSMAQPQPHSQAVTPRMEQRSMPPPPPAVHAGPPPGPPAGPSRGQSPK